MQWVYVIVILYDTILFINASIRFTMSDGSSVETKFHLPLLRYYD